VDTSKTCKYCIDIKGWKGIRHTECKCFTKKREAGKKSKKVEAQSEEEDNGNILCIKAGKIETKDGYFQYDTATTHYTTNKPGIITNPQYGEFIVKGHDESTSNMRDERDIVFHRTSSSMTAYTTPQITI